MADVYDKGFQDLVKYCEENFQGSEEDFLGDKFIIGGGNPDSRILFIGKEASRASDNPLEDYNTVAHYRQLLDSQSTDSNLWIRDRESEINFCKKHGLEIPEYWGPKANQKVWYNYQKLFDIIEYGLEGGLKREHPEKMDFETKVFCSELNGIPMSHSDYGPRSMRSLKLRKERFFTHEFFSRFDVVIIFGSGNYIQNYSENPEEREIDRLFGVEFRKPVVRINRNNAFWVHRERQGFPKRLVIQTRNPSNGVSPELIEKLGSYVHEYIRGE